MVIAGRIPSPFGRNSQAPSSTPPSAGTFTLIFKTTSNLLTNRLSSSRQSARVRNVGGCLGSDSPKRDSRRQDDFAERPILSQMAQGFARLAEGIDPPTDRLDSSALHLRDYLPPPPAHP